MDDTSDKKPRPGAPTRPHGESAPAWARRLRAARDRAGLTVRELAALAGLDEDVAGRYDRGERVPSVLAAVRLCRALGLPVEDAFGE